MWAKQLVVFRFKDQKQFNQEDLRVKLGEFPFKPCGATDISKMGWVPPLGTETSDMLYSSGSDLVLTCAKEEKKVPSRVVKEALDERVALLEKERGAPLKKKEKDELKSEIILDLLPRCFPKRTHFQVIILPSSGFLAVTAGSVKQAETIVSLLRKTMGSCAVVPCLPEMPIETTLTEWVKRSFAASGFKILEDIELRSLMESGSIIRGRKQNLESEKLLSHLEDGSNVVSRLTLEWQERLSFTFTADGLLKTMRWSDELLEDNEDVVDPLARKDADTALMVKELEVFLQDLYSALGGLPTL
ncbi:recombination-associated protein RdgC [Vibrio mediterranei]|uniref:recombination-associated protein RdgC n=1 Tax=Vibrio mediterranei TaxID=689 RepID=UPI0040694EB6